MKIKVIKFNDFKLPQRAHFNDSGADCFSAIDVVIPAHSCVRVPTGIGLELPDGYDVTVQSKSGLSTKGIICANAVVDAGYKGEIHALVVNVTDEPYEFKKGDKIGQFVFRQVLYPEFVEELGEERGNHGFGSTGK